MKHAVFTFGRFNPPTESGHGKLIGAVKAHAEKVKGDHFVFPSHSSDPKKNPLSHEDKVAAMHKVFPGTNIVSHKKIRNAIDAVKHLSSQGYTHVTMVTGGDRTQEFHKLLHNYNGKEYNVKHIEVKSAGDRDPDAEGSKGMSASKMRKLASSGKKEEFVKHYSNPEHGHDLYNKVRKGMKLESVNPIAIFLFGGPGSGKDYVLNNIFSKFDLVEVQIDQILSGKAMPLIEKNTNIVINGSAYSSEKMELVKAIMEGYSFDSVYVSVSNKASRERNLRHSNPLREEVRIRKLLEAEKLSVSLEDPFIFDNSINLFESTELDKLVFASQIENLLARLMEMGLEMKASPSKILSFREALEQPLDRRQDKGFRIYYKTGNDPTPKFKVIKAKNEDAAAKQYKRLFGGKILKIQAIGENYVSEDSKLVQKEEANSEHGSASGVPSEGLPTEGSESVLLPRQSCGCSCSEGTCEGSCGGNCSCKQANEEASTIEKDPKLTVQKIKKVALNRHLDAVKAGSILRQV